MFILQEQAVLSTYQGLAVARRLCRNRITLKYWVSSINNEGGVKTRTD